MITAVHIEGFQSHTKSQFNIDAGLNVITGPSGSGKTAILRAIKWVAFNEPQGEAYVNVKGDEAVVTVYLDSGAIITKRRRKGKTSYLLQMTEEDEGSLFEKSEVPEEVKRVLQIEKQTFGDFETALNFSFQLDAPFLLSETASAGAKILGKLAGTESVDLAIKGISKDTYASRQDRTNAEKDMERIAGAMLAYAHIDDAKEALDVAEMLLEQIEAQHKRAEDLKGYRGAYETVANLLNVLGRRLDNLMIVPQLEDDLQDIEKVQQRYNLLLDLYASYDRLGERLAAISSDLRAYAEVGQASQILEEVQKQAEKLVLISSIAKDHQKYTDVYSRTEKTLENLQHVNEAANGIDDVTTQLGRLMDITALRIDYQFTEKARSRSVERLKAFDDLIVVEDILNGTEAILDNLGHLQRINTNYDWGKADLERCKTSLTIAEADLAAAQAEERAAWDAAGGYCPLCEQSHERGTCS